MSNIQLQIKLKVQSLNATEKAIQELCQSLWFSEKRYQRLTVAGIEISELGTSLAEEVLAGIRKIQDLAGEFMIRINLLSQKNEIHLGDTLGDCSTLKPITLPQRVFQG